jgi:predicted alpha/beta superfamily hydrolase
MTVAKRTTSTNRGHACEYFSPVETFVVHSRYIPHHLRVRVMLPARYRGDTLKFPVVYATDGDFTFDALKGISHSIQRFDTDAPRFILVGIGYSDDSPLAGCMLSRRDMTFPGYPKLSDKPPAVEGVLPAEEDLNDSCGAEDFQHVIAEELIPTIDTRYPTVPGDRTYFGHSQAGSFGLFTMFTRPELFRNYVISSPGLTLHGESSGGVQYENYDFVVRRARELIASGRSLSGIKLYMSVGSEEEFEPSFAEWQLTSSFHRMASLMRDSESMLGLKMTAEEFPGETHLTVWPIAFIHGLQAVFGTKARVRR